MNKFALTDVIIELHVPDFDKVKDFYEKLGFIQVWEYPVKDQSGYLVMKRSSSILAFFCGNEEVYNHDYFKRFSKTTVRGYGVEIAIHITDQPIEDYYQTVKDKINEEAIVQPLIQRSWGTKDFRLIDPFGYYFCFREDEDILAP